ncbi:hypothetical protein DNTS_023893 [Danionella cerebrum]|uniref:Uncharacterized protein n=1 Tax=Danionella cerebrum TaxID=2873325 RepID=A0A553MUW8_9TELE|nr:hypothetical protein DNTS_023893 [Danionella translucida]
MSKSAPVFGVFAHASQRLVQSKTAEETHRTALDPCCQSQSEPRQADRERTRRNRRNRSNTECQTRSQGHMSLPDTRLPSLLLLLLLVGSVCCINAARASELGLLTRTSVCDQCNVSCRVQSEGFW